MNLRRAGILTRLKGVLLSCFAVGIGLVGLFAMPEQCQAIGRVAAALFMPAGAWLLFISLRGRKSDLGELSRSAADSAASGGIGVIVSEAVDNLP